MLNYLVSIFIVVEICERKRSLWSGKGFCEETGLELNPESREEGLGHSRWGDCMDKEGRLWGQSIVRKVERNRLGSGAKL